MKILAISSEPYLPKLNPLFSIYVLNQIKLNIDTEREIDLMSLSYLPFSCLFMPTSSYLFDRGNFNNSNSVFSAMLKQFIPIRFQNEQRVYNRLMRHGMKRFENYLEIYGRPDLIHAHNCFYAGAFAKLIWDKYKIPFVVTEHSSLMFSSQSKMSKQIINQVFESSRAFTCVSAALKQKVSHNLINNTDGVKISILPNALDEIYEEGDFPVTRPEISEFIFINVANLVEVKNHDLLIDSFYAKFAGKQNVKLKIIGDGLLIRKLKAKVSQLGMENQIIFLGYQDKSVVKSELLKSNAFVLSSINETFGIVVTEAFACGLPVVSTPCYGPEMLINNLNGIISRNHSIDALGDAMVECFQNISKYDRSEIKFRCIEKFGREQFKQNIKNIYSIN